MSILDKIIQQKKHEINDIQLKENYNSDFTKRSFLQQLSIPKLHLIAEVKKASPSKGIIYKNFDPINLAKTFENNGASCISVLTDETFFKGNKSYLTRIKKEINIPVLRKDFIIDPLQVIESNHIGADIILLILDILSINQANELIQAAEENNLETLIEIHSDKAFNKIEKLNNAPIIGINNRDLNTFSCSLNRAKDLSKKIKEQAPKTFVIAESGYSEANQMSELEKDGLNGVLIGEGLSKNKGLLEWFKHEG